jgi:hypothetical protein
VLLGEAIEAAHRGDCAKVADRVSKIRVVDPDVYRGEVVRHPELLACSAK